MESGSAQVADDLPPLPEGFTELPPLPEGYREAKSTTEDVARSVGSGIAMTPANIAGTAGDLVEYAKSKGVPQKILDIIPWLPPFAAFSAVKKYATGSAALPTSESIKEATGLKNLDYEPETGAGEIGKRTGEFLGGAAIAPARSAGQFAANLARFGLAPAAGSESTGALAHSYLPPGFEPPARLAGSFIASAAATKRISPHASEAPQASRLAHAEHVANTENALGIKVTPGEKANSTLLRIQEDEANPDHYLANREAVTRRATADVAPEFSTPTLKPPKVDAAGNIVEESTLGKMRKDIGQKFDRVTQNPRNTLELDQTNGPKTGIAINNLTNKYVHAAGYDQDAVNALQNAASHVSEVLAANGPSARTGLTHLTGEQYQRMRSSLMDAAMASEGQKKNAYHDFIDVLDNAFDRSLKTYNPSDVGKIQDARKQWRAFLTVEKAAGRSDVDHLTPAALESAAQSTYGKRAHLQGQDPFWWAPSAKSVLRTEANSNTARRKEARDAMGDWLGLALAPLGYAVGLHTGGSNAEHAVGGLLMAERAAGPLAKVLHPYVDKVAAIPHVQALVGNQLLAGAPGLLGGRAGPITAATALRPPDYEDENKRRLRISLP
jgi:hypothetical protein